MKFIISSESLLKNLQVLGSILNNNNTLPILDCFLFEIENKDHIEFISFYNVEKLNSLFKNLGRADITYLVNFSLLKEFFLKKKLKVKKIVSQKFFLEKMGIIQRARILEKKMTQKQEEYMSLTLMRLLHKDLMGGLFKVIFAFKSKKNNFLGFD